MPFDAPHIGGDRRSLLRSASLSKHEPVPDIFEIADAEFLDRDRLTIELAFLSGVAAPRDLAEQDFRLAPCLLGSPNPM
jgi:hypothetical protein